MQQEKRLKVLIIEDDEDDYVLVRDLLSEVSSTKYDLDWVAGYHAAQREMARPSHDIYLLDYRLGEHNGLELLHEAARNGCSVPIILLTGQGDYAVDIEAMEAGAADYLVKGQISADLLERSIRYSIERKHSERQLKLLSSQLLAAQEDERKRIARELHDSIGSSLTAIKFSLENTLGAMNDGPPPQELVKTLIATTQHAIDESRRIMTDLRPSILDDLGIVVTIGWVCRRFQVLYPDLAISKTVEVLEDDVPDPLKIVVYRILQEALNNVVKHSKATEVQITLVKRESALGLKVEDNGEGCDIESILHSGDRTKGGMGLIGMRERVELSGGAFTIDSKIGRGTAIRATWRLL